MTTDVDHLAELDDPNDPDSDYGRGYQAALDAERHPVTTPHQPDLRAVLAAVLPAHRDMVLAEFGHEASEALLTKRDELREAGRRKGRDWSGRQSGLEEAAHIVRRLAAATPPPRPSEPQTAEQTEVVPQATPGPRTAGICGTTAPTIAQGATDMICTLPAGHAGWHHADNGADFTLGESLTYEELESDRAGRHHPRRAVGGHPAAGRRRRVVARWLASPRWYPVSRVVSPTPARAPGDVGADPGGEQETAHPAASADIRTEETP